jgi:hypothetical protein
VHEHTCIRNRETFTHIQLKKLMSIVQHLNNEWNMLHNPRICMCLHVPAAGSLKLALLMGSGIWSRDGFAWETRHIAYFIKIKSTLPVISEGYTIGRTHDVEIFSKCWISKYCRCYNIDLRFIIFKDGCSDSFSTGPYYI